MKEKDRVIYLADADAFFASVEETFHPEYKTVPMAVAGDPETRRGIVLAKNPLAKKCGIKTAETIHSAKQKCPNLVLAPPRMHAYYAFCERINAIYEQYTDQVERFSVDESWLDVTGSLHLFGGDPVALAHEIRQRVEREIGITISIGISWNKIFAKLGSDLNKPNNICLISRENYKEVAWRLPVGDLFSVGKTTADTLRKQFIQTIGELAAADAGMLRHNFGKMGDQLHLFANGLDTSPVARVGEQEPVKSVGKGLTFRRDLETEHDIKTGISALADSVAARLRKANMKCSTVQLTIKNTALQSIQRQKRTKQPTYLAADIAQTAMEIIKASWNLGKPIRMLTVTAQNLTPVDQATLQLSLFDEADDGKGKRTENLEKTLDSIRKRYGKHSIQPGVILKNDLGISEHDEEE